MSNTETRFFDCYDSRGNCVKSRCLLDEFKEMAMKHGGGAGFVGGRWEAVIDGQTYHLKVNRFEAMKNFTMERSNVS